MTFYDEVKPLYSCYRFKDDFVKIVKFKRRDGNGGCSTGVEKTEQDREGERFLASLSRSRSAVLQYALSNDWDYFFTGTIDASMHDRFNLDSFASRFLQFIRDLRKRTGAAIQYLLVPERHKNGAWHIHGLLSGLPAASVVPFDKSLHPLKLVEKGYLNWIDYSNKFGFCSLGRISDPVKVAFYISKYITKDLGNDLRGVGSHLYFASRGISKASHYGDCYANSSQLDAFLSHDYDFCAVGYGRLPWDFACEYFDGIEYASSEPLAQVKPVQVSIEDFVEWRNMQMAIDGFVKREGGIDLGNGCG